MHGLIGDQLFEQISRRGPGDPVEHQKTGVEPGRQQILQICVEGPEFRVLPDQIEKVGTKIHKKLNSML